MIGTNFIKALNELQIVKNLTIFNCMEKFEDLFPKLKIPDLPIPNTEYPLAILKHEWREAAALHRHLQIY